MIVRASASGFARLNSGDEVTVSFDRYTSPVETQEDAFAGTVTGSREEYDQIQRVIISADDGERYAVNLGGTVDQLKDGPVDAGIGRAATIKVTEEVEESESFQ